MLHRCRTALPRPHRGLPHRRPLRAFHLPPHLSCADSPPMTSLPAAPCSVCPGLGRRGGERTRPPWAPRPGELAVSGVLAVAALGMSGIAWGRPSPVPGLGWGVVGADQRDLPGVPPACFLHASPPLPFPTQRREPATRPRGRRPRHQAPHVEAQALVSEPVIYPDFAFGDSGARLKVMRHVRFGPGFEPRLRRTGDMFGPGAPAFDVGVGAELDFDTAGVQPKARGAA